MDYRTDNAALSPYSAWPQPRFRRSPIGLPILFVRCVPSHLSRTGHDQRSFPPSSRTGLPKANLVSEAEILGTKGDGHAMPLVMQQVKTRSLLALSHSPAILRRRAQHKEPAGSQCSDSRVLMIPSNRKPVPPAHQVTYQEGTPGSQGVLHTSCAFLK